MVFTTGAKIGFFGEYIYLCQDINECKMKRTSLLMLFFLLLFQTACHKYEQIQIVSGKVESLNMNGLRSVDLKMEVGVSNPAGRIVFEEVNGTLKHFGKVLGNVSLAPFELCPKTVREYSIDAKIVLDKGMTFVELMSFTDVKKIKECTIDISAKGKASGVKIKKEYKNIPLKKLLEDPDNDKI